MEFSEYEKFLKIFSSIDIKKDLSKNFANGKYTNKDKNYQCNILIHFFRNFEKIEKEFNVNYFTNNKKIANNNAFGNNNSNSGGLFGNNFINKNAFGNNISISRGRFGNNNRMSAPAVKALFSFGRQLAPKKKAKVFTNIFNKNEENFEEDLELKNNEIKLEKNIMKTSIFSGEASGKFLLDFISLGFDILQKDSHGKDILFYCIIENNFELIKFLFLNFKNKIKNDIVDNENKGLIHYVVNPLENISYENVLLLKYLISEGIKHDIIDNSGKTAIDYALERKSNVLINCFEELNLITKSEIEIRRNAIFNKQNYSNEKDKEFPNFFHKNDYHKDAENSINETILKGKNILKKEILPDSVGQFDISKNKVIKEILQNQKEDFYDVTLTKVNIGNGLYGQYMFYRMQVIHDVDRNVYILWNRWGRIPEEGAFQRTPFISLIEAKNEFKKIFKSKSGNDWENKESKFFIFFYTF